MYFFNFFRFQLRSRNRSHVQNAKKFPRKSARIFPSLYHEKPVKTFPKPFVSRIPSTYLVKFPKKSVPPFPRKSATKSPCKLLNTCPKRWPKRCARAPNPRATIPTVIPLPFTHPPPIMWTSPPTSTPVTLIWIPAWPSNPDPDPTPISTTLMEWKKCQSLTMNNVPFPSAIKQQFILCSPPSFSSPFRREFWIFECTDL